MKSIADEGDGWGEAETAKWGETVILVATFRAKAVGESLFRFW